MLHTLVHHYIRDGPSLRRKGSPKHKLQKTIINITTTTTAAPQSKV